MENACVKDRKTMKIIDYDVVKDLSVLHERKIVVYGTGVYGDKIMRVLSNIQLTVSFCVQTKPSQSFFFDKPVLSLENFLSKQDCEEFLVIIASEKYYEEILKSLDVCTNIVVCSYYAVIVSLFFNYRKNNLNYEMQNKIEFFLSMSRDIKGDSFYFIRWLADLYAEILDCPEKVWLYQPGKVGSSTIYASSSLELIHMHSLAAMYAGSENEVYKKMLFDIKKKPIKIITGVREPISRDLSAFFQDSERNIYPLFLGSSVVLTSYADYYRVPKWKSGQVYMWENNLQTSFEKICQIMTANHADEFSWFDYEIKALFDIDIFEYPFDKERGYTVIEKDNIQIFVYKCEKLSELEKEIGEFIGDKDFKLTNSNVGAKKVYSYTYKAFKEDVQIDRAYFDYYYENPKWLSHFYTESEIAGFRKKWESKLKD